MLSLTLCGSWEIFAELGNFSQRQNACIRPANNPKKGNIEQLYLFLDNCLPVGNEPFFCIFAEVLWISYSNWSRFRCFRFYPWTFYNFFIQLWPSQPIFDQKTVKQNLLDGLLDGFWPPARPSQPIFDQKTVK